jgi:hypothetical protein
MASKAAGLDLNRGSKLGAVAYQAANQPWDEACECRHYLMPAFPVEQ